MKSRKIISTILASAMVFGLVPGFVFADETEETDIPEIVIEEEEPEEAEPEEEILEEEVIEEDPEEVEEEQAEEIVVEEADEEEVDALSGTCGENATWTYDADTKTLTISGEGEMYGYRNVATPWDDYHTEIENLVIEEGITNVGKEAFLGCEQLSSITLPDTLLTIDDGAFSRCESLVSITIPDSVTTITGFYYCSSLEEVFFGENSELETISGVAFSYCESLTTFTVPSSVTSIGYYAFQSCTSLQDIYCYADPDSLSWDDYDIESYMPDKGTTVHVYSDDLRDYDAIFTRINVTFAGDLEYCGDHACGDDAVYSFDPATGTLTISGTGEMYDYESEYDIPWYSYKDEITSIVVEEGITSIGINCFFTLGSVQEISLPDGLTGIGICAFYWCDDITEITLPDTLEYIGEGAFYMCGGVTDVYFYMDPADLTWDTLDGYDSFKADSTTKLHVCYGYADIFASKFPGLDVTYVEDRYQNPCGDNCYWTYDADTKTLTISGEGKMYSYWNVTRPWDGFYAEIENLVIEEGITNVGSCAFMNCSNLKNVSFPDSLKTIDDYAFRYCYSIEDVKFGEDSQLEKIYYFAFDWCSGLTSLTIPSSVIQISTDAFSSCKSLKDIYCYADPDSLNWYDTDSYSYMYDKATKVHVYSEDFDGFTDKFSSVNVTFVGDLDAYENNPCGDHAYYSFDDVTGTLTISGSGEMYDYNSFGDSPWYSFKDDITSIVVDEDITSIGDHCFKDLGNVETVSLPDGLTEIGICAFFWCDDLTEIELPDTLEYIGADAFGMCFGVTDVYCYMDPENLTWDTHQGYNNFQEDSATRLHIYYDYADDFASKFPDLDITYVTDRYVNACGDTCGWTYDEDTKTLTIVGTGDMWDYNYNSYDGSGAAPWYKDYAYEMEKIVISDGIERIGDCAFLYCMYVTEVVVPDSVTEIGKKAFFTCYRIPEIYFPDGVSSIGDSAFANCIAIEEVTIPASVVSIGEGAFSGCDKLKTVNIEKDSLLQSIGNWAFSSCDLLECIELPESVQFIGASAFYYCESMSYIVITSDPSELEWDVNNSYPDFKEDGTTECRVPWRYYQDYVDNFSYKNAHFVGNLVYLSINDTENGNVNNTSGYATYRDTYTLDIVPDQGYVVDTITVTKQNGDTVEVDMSDYSFKVPGTEEATVTVTFKEASGWIKGIDGTYTYYENGTKVTGWKKISGKYYFFNDDGVMQTGWLKDGKKWYYLTGSGDMVTGWKQISKKWYYFNAAGDMVTGWKKIGSKYYFFNTSGAMQTGWLKDGSKYYYLGTDGAMVTGWQKVSGKWYYFNTSGVMQTGWQKIGNKWYYFQSSGAMQTSNLTYKGKVYYFNADGSCKNP